MSPAQLPYPEDEHQGARDRRLAFLADSLGVPLPPFPGPLVAFHLDGHTGEEDPIFLGGDLHATHPDASASSRVPDHDRALDNAIVTLADHESEVLQVAAIEGIWCTALSGERLSVAPFLSITDSDGSVRTWLLLPPPRQMVGTAHLWLPSVPPSADPRSRGH